MQPYRIALLGATLLTGCNGPDDQEQARMRSGEQLYNHHCASCHKGSGDGAFLRGVPPVKYSTLSYQQLADHIRGHGRGADSRMPTFSAVSQGEAEAIALYVRHKLQFR